MPSFKEQIDKIVNQKVKDTVKLSKSGKISDEIGEFAKSQIIRRTKLGNGVATRNGPEGKFLALADSTVKQRRRMALAIGTRPKKSNLTRTGKMLDSIIYKVLSRGKVEIKFNNSVYSDGTSVKDVANYHDNKGAGKSLVKRPFFELSAKDLKKISIFIRKKVRLLLRK